MENQYFITIMTTLLQNSITIEHATYTFVFEKIGDTYVLNLDGKKGGFVFIKKTKLSRWMRFAKWFDLKVLGETHPPHPRQWVDISWFNKDGKHMVRSYYFIPIGRPEGKTSIAPHVASLALIYSFMQGENRLSVMPDFIQVHYQSVFDNKNQNFIYGKVMDNATGMEVISSFVICSNMFSGKKTVQGNQVIH